MEALWGETARARAREVKGMEDPQRTSTGSAPWRGIWQWLSELKMHLPENSTPRNLPSGTLALWESYVDKDIHSSRRLEPLKRSPTGANGLSDGHRNLLCPLPLPLAHALQPLGPPAGPCVHPACCPSTQPSDLQGRAPPLPWREASDAQMPRCLAASPPEP